MLEIISNLRNNNLRKIPGYDPSTIERLRKVLRAAMRDPSKLFVLFASFSSEKVVSLINVTPP